MAHAFITDHYKGIETDISDYTERQISQAQNAALSYWNWEKQHKFEFIFAEEALVSEAYEYGGTIDIHAIVDGIREIIDLKSGSGIWPEHLVQVDGGYRRLMLENNYQVDRARIINIPRAATENFTEQVLSDTDIYWEIFKNLLSIYKLKKKLRK